MREPGASHPTIDWADGDTVTTPAPVSLERDKMKSAWLLKFLSATGVKQEHAVAQDFEVTLPKKN